MPLYEYQCASCEKVHEIVQKFSDAPLTECPDCKGLVSKLISMNSFALKGSGWYTTDYKRKPAITSAPAATTTATPPAAPAPAAVVPTVAPAKTT